MHKAPRSSYALFSFALLGSTLLSSAAVAQLTPQNVPGSARSERATERFRDDARPPVGVGAIIEAPDEKAKVNLPKGQAFTLKGVSFQGNEGLDEAALQAQVASYVGQKASLASLHEMTAKLTTYIRNEGYILSRAVLPPQTIGAGGTVKVRIIEGFVNSVSFTGDATSDEGLLGRMAQKIRDSKPLKAADLERYLLLMEDLPGVTARATIQPARNVTGASDIIININKKFLDFNATLDNRGSKFLGPLQASAAVSANNVFGIYDRTQVRQVRTLGNRELRYTELVHEEQIGSEGTKGVLSASYTDALPGHSLSALDVESQTRTFAAALRHPFIRSRQDNVYGILEAVVRDTDATTLDNRLYNDRTRTVRATGSYDFVDGLNAVNKTDLSVTKGFGIFDTDPAGGIRSRADGEDSFSKFNASISRLQPLGGPFSMLTTAAGQYANNALLASEEFGLGGEEFASAFDASEVTGDHGAAFKVELQYNQFLETKWLQYYQLYTYYDIGKVWNKGNISTNDSVLLNSAGLGVRFNMLDTVSGSLDLALPINREVTALGEDGDQARVFFTLAYRY